ncbi:hypothetical protein ALI144C_10475 [Actinosynnema sp. ALI-1.44]|uniref:hypothetical protein n=1 Tax=Actinosynnema sp. ALI-1.44 TaxID=1933779 RepID=UPI00097C01C9|nr:hypothetical protein [Actinosynnema sp. ALI-1.44]ONI87048.1 hypothetical protein ALI144C_10475 [Actinosynnema sp. ALI-1.44]
MVPPTDRPAVEEPLLVQELAVEKRAGAVALVWQAVWVVGVIALHLVLASPFTGATLLVYALPLLLLVGVVIMSIARQSAMRRLRRKLGTRAWQWIAPERLRFRGRTVIFDLDDGTPAQVRLFTNASADLSRQHGMWMITDHRGQVHVRTAGSTMRLPVYTGEDDLHGEPGEPDPTHSNHALATITILVPLVVVGLLWLGLGDPVDAYRQQPATVIVVALIVLNFLAGLPKVVAAYRRTEPAQWHEIPISITGIGYHRPWSTGQTVHGTSTLPDGTTVDVRIPDVHMDLVASMNTTAKLWVADPPKPSTKSVTGLPGDPARAHVWFGKAAGPVRD